MRCIVLLLIGSGCLLAQSAGIPRLGWVEGDQPGSIRALVGIPGAALAVSPDSIASARSLVFRPGSAMALIVMQEGTLALAQLERLPQEDGLRALAGSIAAPAVAAWSPMGAIFVLASATEARLQVWRMDGEEARLLREWPVLAQKAAVSDGGDLLAQIDGILYRLDESGSMQEVTRTLRGEFTFLAATRRYAWRDESGTWLAGGDGETVSVPLPEPPEAGVRLLASPAPGRLVVADSSAEAANVTLWSGRGENLGEWELPASVTEVAPTGAEGVIQLKSHGGGPVWLGQFDRTGGRIFFVPRAELHGGESR